MNRLQKKCLVGSLVFHGLLGLTFVVTSAFRPRSAPKDNVVQLSMVPTKAIDLALASGGGTPPAALPKEEKKADPLPPPLPPEIIKKAPEPPKVEKPPEEKIPPAIKEKTIPAPKEKPKETKEDLLAKVVDRSKTKPKPQTNSVKVDLNRMTKRSPSPTVKPDNRAQEVAAQIERRRTQAAFANAVKDIRDKGAGATVVDTPGQGGGGEAYADYKSIIYTIYLNAWHPPDLATDDESTAQAKIVISRNGEILSSRIEKKSGNTALDKSVEAALKRVERIPLSFPETSKDQQRSFNINFNLKAKNSFG